MDKSQDENPDYATDDWELERAHQKQKNRRALIAGVIGLAAAAICVAWVSLKYWS